MVVGQVGEEGVLAGDEGEGRDLHGSRGKSDFCITVRAPYGRVVERQYNWARQVMLNYWPGGWRRGEGSVMGDAQSCVNCRPRRVERLPLDGVGCSVKS